eukprot:TRINITY_DN27452_c0_g1_i1.p1 TRINITY_DN27452_c0_g1~~TRINITY_DN27452_c0_g1_i1.p1  ORF type:complete len:1070 (-),score=344.13 TRINITY_DN27452_c0_g1_i1:73-3246(-)
MEKLQVENDDSGSDSRFSGKRKLSSEGCDERVPKKFHSDASIDDNPHIKPNKHKKLKKRDLLELSGQVVRSKDGVIELENGKRFRKIHKHKKKSKEKSKDDSSTNIDNTKEGDKEKCLDGSLVKHKKKKKHKDRRRDSESGTVGNTVVEHGIDADCLGEGIDVQIEHNRVKHKKKKKYKDNEVKSNDCPSEVPDQHDLVKHKKKNKHMERIRDDINVNSGNVASFNGHRGQGVLVPGCLGEVPGEQLDQSHKKRKKKKKSKDKDRVEIFNHDQVTTNDKAEVSGFIVDALSEVFDKPKKKKKKRSKEERQPNHSPDDPVAKETDSVLQGKEEQLESLIPHQFDSTRRQTSDDSLNISQLLVNNSVSGVLDNTESLIDKINANRALSSTPTKSRKMNRKLATKSDLNLLSNPEESEMCNSSFILDSSIASSLDLSLPGTQESNSSSSLPTDYSLHTSQDQIMPVVDQTDEIPSASSVSWHVPESRVVARITPQKSFIKNLVKNALNQVLSEPSDTIGQGVDPLDQTSATSELAVDPLDQKFSQPTARPTTPGQRRSLVNYEQLCKTFLSDPASALQVPSSSPEDGNKRKENKRLTPSVEEKDSPSAAVETPRDRGSKKRKTSSTAQQPPTATQSMKEGNNNYSSELTLRLHSLRNQPTTAQKKATIGELYRLPSRKKVPMVVFQACQFIFSQNTPVSQLNTVYTGHCVPREREYREILRKKFGAKFGNFYEEQDLKILRRFNTLIENRVVEDKAEFCNFLNTYCSGKDIKELRKSSRSIGVRNIVGLFVGQDMPHKIAAVNCLRLIKLVLGASNLFRDYKQEVVGETETSDSQPQEEQTHDDLETNEEETVPCSRVAKPVKTSVNRWTMEEDQTLMDLVIGRDGVTRVENVDLMMVDWAGISEQFPGRRTQYVREHWCRVIQAILVEDSEPDAILNYRRRLLEEVVKMGAGHKKDIHWTKLAKTFHPRSSYVIQHNFHALIKGGPGSEPIADAEEFQERVAAALAKVERLAQLPEEMQAKFLKRIAYKEQLRDYYLGLISPQSRSAPTESESDESSSP